MTQPPLQVSPSSAAGAAGAAPPSRPPSRPGLPLLTLGALGVVYGDIGTSPIYAFRIALNASGRADGGAVLGLLSLIVWTLTLVVTVKYILFLTRADNRGEGGPLALMALARAGTRGRWRGGILALGVVGAGLLFGDALITPAISVLSATEGLTLVSSRFAPWVIPITLVILLGLFGAQRFGAGRVALVFGPVIALWFITLGVTGAVQIIRAPEVLWALDPLRGAAFLWTNPGIALAVMGAVFLAVTGGEAMYADLGHFGRRPVVLAWFALVFPALLLNYFGQGAFVLRTGAAENPLFLMQGERFLPWFVVLATLAAVIASQAMISGVSSMTRQAVALNLLPRLRIIHTSAQQFGQIYMPQVNAVLMAMSVLLVLWFGSSAALAGAYGVAVSGLMVTTTLMLAIVMVRVWKWRRAHVLLAVLPLLAIDIGLFGANLTKLTQGGWATALAAAIVCGVVASWMAGRRRLATRTRRLEMPLDALVAGLERAPPHIVPGAAVFLASDAEEAPTALLHSLKHYKVLHRHNAILTVRTAHAPRVADDGRVRVERYNPLFSRIIVTFGFMETPDLPAALRKAPDLPWTFDMMSTSFFLSRRSLKPSGRRGPAGWSERLFIALTRNGADATDYFRIPTGRVVEIGTQVAL